MSTPNVANFYASDYDFNGFESTLTEDACIQVLAFLTKKFLKKTTFLYNYANIILISLYYFSLKEG